MAARLPKLLSIRLRVVGDLEHHRTRITNLTNTSGEAIISFRSVALENTWGEFTHVKTELDKLSAFHELPNVNELVETNRNMEDLYLEMKQRIATLLPEHDMTLNETYYERNNRFAEEPSNISTPNQTRESNVNVKMPPIPIPVFSGTYEDWPEFSVLFTRLMNKMKGPNLDKMFYLKRALCQEAKQLIQHLNNEDGNFDEAWSLLQSRYENFYLIVNSQLKRWFELPDITHTSVGSIRAAIDQTKTCLSSMRFMNIDTNSWDVILVFALRNKLSAELAMKWEEFRGGDTQPATWEKFAEFLEIRFKILACTPQKSTMPKAVKKPAETYNNQIDDEDGDDEADHILYNQKTESCLICDEKHRVFKCHKFEKHTPTEMVELIEKRGLCINCLYKHRVEDCQSKFSCKICGQRHNTRLHDAFVHLVQEIENLDEGHTTLHVRMPTQTILATAMIPVFTKNGDRMLFKALLDQGSTTNLISEHTAQLLQCPRQKVHIPLRGVNGTPTGSVKHATHITIGSLYNDEFRLTIDALVLNKITTIKPKHAQLNSIWSHLHNLQLADPTHDQTGTIDILIGAATFSEILEKGLIKGKQNEPIAQLTKLGWVISGTHQDEHAQVFHVGIDENAALTEQLKTFWEVEEMIRPVFQSPENEHCEEFFKKTTYRHFDGKLVVKLPFKIDPNDPNFLGKSDQRALAQFKQIERKLTQDAAHKAEYEKCINEYISLGHASLLNTNPSLNYMLPHHSVVKMSSTTTKVRVVFNASCRSSNGFSLNDRLHTGPTIQSDIWSVLLRFLLRRVAMVADLEKMYRQIWLHENDRKFQQIFWRATETGEIERYQLNTVTFGTASAPFLAIRSLHYIADEVESQTPSITRIIKQNFYVDDLMTTCDNIEEAKRVKNQLVKTFSTYGFNLRQWNANMVELLDEDIVRSDVEVKLNTPPTCKTLGMVWNTYHDTLGFKFTRMKEIANTKRKILSSIATTFDPLGWLTPGLIKSKIFMQKLWLLTYNWDDILNDDTMNEWQGIQDQLYDCSEIVQKRWLGISKTNKHIALHGFADASERAYAAVVYLRVIHQDDTVSTHIISSKTKVAPLKSISLPRLELCAALLLAQLIDRIKATFDWPNIDMYCWTDSMAVLAWVSAPPYTWKTFEANRVAEIQNLINPIEWRYVNTKNNPADSATRGLSMKALHENQSWWHGPPFLMLTSDKWPKIPTIKEKPPVRMRKILMNIPIPMENDLLNRYSSLTRLINITAIILRWRQYKRATATLSRKHTTVLSPKEMTNAKTQWIKYIQQQFFEAEITNLQRKHPISSRSPLLSLVPILDGDGVLRVHGRLRHADMAMHAKYPIILPAKSRLTWLVIHYAHLKTEHGNLETTLRFIRDEFWIIRGGQIVRNQLSKCMRCFYIKCKPAQQLMADLRPPQVQQNRPFAHTGVDFAGYFEVKASIVRNASYIKCYVALFICLTTKAIHLELVKNLSTEEFLAAITRFIGRRGIPSHMYSDRGTNFIGCPTEMPQLFIDKHSPEYERIIQQTNHHMITWHFNPARAPHFGGLWEAGVKSMKTQLKKILTTARLTSDEFNTVLIQVEACLNSRPLCPVTSDPSSFEAITPGHFLIGQALNSMPYPDVTNQAMSKLSRLQLLHRLAQQFWKSWSHEYLSRLQQRPKWRQQHENLKPGQLVVVMDDNMAVTQWKMARIIRVFASSDALVRSAEIQIGDKTTTRPIVKLCLLPIEDNMNEEENEILLTYIHQ